LPAEASARVTPRTPSVVEATTIPALTPDVVLPSATAATAATTLAATPYDVDLLERLRAQRTKLARAEAVPPYCVFTDHTLREMATHVPADQAALLRIYGVGAAKVRKYGEIFLTLIREYRTQQTAPEARD
jgi:superfamily II DNA helicase RecQ